jgi:OmpA-OmpF porin, OOP family
MKRTIAAGMLMLLAGAACDRRPRPEQTPASEWTAAQQPAQQPPPAAKPERSIMRPAVAQPEPAPPPPPPTHVTVPFAEPSPALGDAQTALIDPLIARLSGGTDRIVLRGSTDSRGADRRNIAVSRRRARLVAAYLERKGIARDRIAIVALGESRPVAPNMTLDGQDDPAGRARNRRVDIDIVPAKGDAADTPEGSGS